MDKRKQIWITDRYGARTCRIAVYDQAMRDEMALLDLEIERLIASGELITGSIPQHLQYSIPNFWSNFQS